MSMSIRFDKVSSLVQQPNIGFDITYLQWFTFFKNWYQFEANKLENKIYDTMHTTDSVALSETSCTDQKASSNNIAV